MSIGERGKFEPPSRGSPYDDSAKHENNPEKHAHNAEVTDAAKRHSCQTNCSKCSGRCHHEGHRGHDGGMWAANSIPCAPHCRHRSNSLRGRSILMHRSPRRAAPGPLGCIGRLRLYSHRERGRGPGVRSADWVCETPSKHAPHSFTLPPLSRGNAQDSGHQTAGRTTRSRLLFGVYCLEFGVRPENAKRQTPNSKLQMGP
jgi:hypothetical protein